MFNLFTNNLNSSKENRQREAANKLNEGVTRWLEMEATNSSVEEQAATERELFRDYRGLDTIVYEISRQRRVAMHEKTMTIISQIKERIENGKLTDEQRELLRVGLRERSS